MESKAGFFSWLKWTKCLESSFFSLQTPPFHFVNVQTPSSVVVVLEDARHSSGAFQELDSLLGRIMSSREERRHGQGRWIAMGHDEGLK